ncbi:MAG: phosphoribosylpyrophosphate synthetase [Flavobacterium sp.]|nr:MAG: phosphoribosylpyrophosphate synthetase [Flavobacterium sp.]
MNELTTLSEVLNNLRLKGYTTDFNVGGNTLNSTSHELELHPDDFVVDKHYRFEGMTDPADEAVVYAISSKKHGLKGVLVNGYGIYSDPISDDLMRTLNEKSKNGK